MRRIRIECVVARHCLIGVCLAFATALTSTQASAETVEARDQARGHFDQGVNLARRHAYAEALSEFQLAYRVFPHFSVLYNIGQALIALDRPSEAISALNRYLEEGGSNIEPRRREEVGLAISTELAKTGSVEVTVDVAGALIAVDDEPRGRSPLASSVRVDSGPHRVVAKLESGAQREAKVDVKAGQVARAELAFEAAPAASPTRGQLRIRCSERGLHVLVDDRPEGVTPLAGALSLEAGGHRVRFERGTDRSEEQWLNVVGQSELEIGCSVPVSLMASHSRQEPITKGAHDSTQKTLGYIVGAAGIALSGAAAAHFFWNRARYQDWQSRYATYYDDPTEQNRESANNLAQSVESASAVTIGLAIGAGVALGTGAVLILTSAGGATPAGNTGAGGPFMTLRGAF